MAITFAHIGMRLRDERNEVISMPVYGRFDDAITVASLKTAVQSIVALVDAISDGNFLKSYVAVEIPLVTSSSAGAGSSIERTALLKALAPDGFIRNYGLDIPCVPTSIFLTGTKKVDLANAAVAALIDDVASPSTAWTYTTPTGVGLSEVVDGRMTFRKHRRIASRS